MYETAFRRTRRAALCIALLPITGSAAGLPPGIGWHELPDTRLRTHCPAEAQYPGLRGNTGCNAVTLAWGGAAFDETGDRLLIAGGGHGDYAGNEVYELALATGAMRRLNAPSFPLRNGCDDGAEGMYADGRPVSRHTYDHLEYLPAEQRMFLFGGSRWQCGFFAADTWTFDPALAATMPAANPWQRHASALAPRADFGVGVVRDPVSGLLYARDNYHLWSWDPATTQWTRRTSGNPPYLNGTRRAVIDPVRRRYYAYVISEHNGGQRTLYAYDIGSPTATTLTITATPAPTCSFMDVYAAGWQYDPVLDRLVAWTGGDAVQLLDPTTATCTTVSHPNGPQAVANGTFGRFRYSPQSGVFVVCNSIDANCRILRLHGAQTERVFWSGFE